jgi:hypothetical protein
MRHILLSFFRALLISALILLLIFFIWIFITFNLGGGETFDELKTQAAALLIALGIFLGVVAFRMKTSLKSGQKEAALGSGILPAIAFMMALIHYTHYLNHHIPFNKATWCASEKKPFDMTVSLVKEHQLIGLSKQRVKDLLGPALENEVEHTGYHAITYYVGGSWILTISFKNNKVVETGLRKSLLSI